MANYNVQVKVLIGNKADIEEKIENYINTIDNTKTIHAITSSYFPHDRVMVIIVHDA